MKWFKRKEVQQTVKQTPSRVEVLPFEYPAKVILAWAKAIEGDAQFLSFLNKNGFEELAIATHAIYLEPSARDWLTQSGFAHIMAMIHGAEGNVKAQNWLKANKFELLYHMARAVDHEEEDIYWIKKNAPVEMQLLTRSIQLVKDRIEENHNDIHSFNKDI